VYPLLFGIKATAATKSVPAPKADAVAAGAGA